MPNINPELDALERARRWQPCPGNRCVGGLVTYFDRDLAAERSVVCSVCEGSGAAPQADFYCSDSSCQLSGDVDGVEHNHGAAPQVTQHAIIYPDLTPAMMQRFREEANATGEPQFVEYLNQGGAALETDKGE